ncbi:MAG: putative glycoside hydrolase [Spirochaetia bacterium]|nr:putative glycoside hydrolase [Spirochaetia bacterium]
MGRSIFFIITIMFFYISMTCVHIPYAYRKSSLLFPEYGRQEVSPGGSQSDIPSIEKSSPQSRIVPSHKENLENNDNDAVSSEKNQVRVNYYDIPAPEFVRGIYISNRTVNSRKSLERIIEDARKNRINTFVVDVQNEMVPREFVTMIKNAGIFPVARIVVFLGGLTTKTPPEKYIGNLLSVMDAAAYQGFLEVQLDYIRYADTKEMEKIPLSFKYKTINSILEKTHEKANSLSIFLSADLFGRVTINENDSIGQKLENFSKFADVIYPMLYPSHYTNDDYRISHPYETVKEGLENSLKRCKNTKIVAYLQGFTWRVNQSGKSFTEYLKDQLQAVDDAGGNGWIIWNAGNDYDHSFEAIASYDRMKRKKVSRLESGPKELL